MKFPMESMPWNSFVCLCQGEISKDAGRVSSGPFLYKHHGALAPGPWALNLEGVVIVQLLGLVVLYGPALTSLQGYWEKKP